MDGFINSKIEKQTIYEIYRACRLCGAGAGYKMPIIQNVVSLDGAEVELKQKIRECVQIEVHQDDKMPPLICELCVDKVNDFYEFLEMCRHTNKRTRLRLGLPPQAMPRGAPDAGDCILGVTEPVFLNNDSSEHSLRSKSKSNKSGKNKKEEKVIISNNSKRDHGVKSESRSLRSRQPSPPRLRGTKRYHDEDVSLSKLQKSKRLSDPVPKSILKKQKEIKTEDDSLLSPRLKRSRDREVSVKIENQSKKVQIQAKPVRATRTSPNIKCKSPPPVHKCKICKVEFNNPKSLNNHLRSHAYKQPVKPIKKEVKEIKCTDCSKTFPNRNLLNIHKCQKQGGDCKICNRHFYSQKSLVRHRSTCVVKKKEVTISPRIRRVLKPLRVRVARCDPLFRNVSGEHYDVSGVAHDYGLDKTCIYPYLYSVSSHVKFEPGYMVNINDDIRQAFDADKYVHWDSEDTESDTDLTDSVKKVDSLTALSLKTIFSQKCLGKVPKKRRKVKAEKAFDSILNVSEFDTELKRGINEIIDSLDDEKIDESINKSKDNDSLFGDENPPAVTNDDFDSLFDNDKGGNNNDEKVNDQDIPNDSSKLEVGVDKNEINDSQVSEESSKDSRLEISKDLNDDSSENVENSENIENTDVINNINDAVVNKIESKEDAEDKVNDLEVNEKLNEEKIKSIDDNLANKENTQIVDSNTNIDIASEETEIVDESSKQEILSDGAIESKNVSSDDKIAENELTTNTEDVMNVNERLQDSEPIDNKTEKLNGDSEEKFDMDDLEDLSDTDMDDKRLMAALDAQIGESEEKTENETEKEEKRIDDFEPCSIKSADLESISDGEFNLNE